MQPFTSDNGDVSIRMQYLQALRKSITDQSIINLAYVDCSLNKDALVDSCKISTKNNKSKYMTLRDQSCPLTPNLY